jgi:hypothetical protein
MSASKANLARIRRIVKSGLKAVARIEAQRKAKRYGTIEHRQAYNAALQKIRS